MCGSSTTSGDTRTSEGVIHGTDGRSWYYVLRANSSDGSWQRKVRPTDKS